MSRRRVAIVVSVQGSSQQLADACEAAVALAVQQFSRDHDCVAAVVHAPLCVEDFILALDEPK